MRRTLALAATAVTGVFVAGVGAGRPAAPFPLGFLPPVAVFLILTVLYGILLSVSAMLLEDMAFRRDPRVRDLALLVLIGVIENLGYRQATAWWRARAFWDYWRGDLGWGRMERRGIGRA